MTPGWWHPEVIEEWVERSRIAQGVPAKVTDPDTLHKVAVLLGAR